MFLCTFLHCGFGKPPSDVEQIHRCLTIQLFYISTQNSEIRVYSATGRVEHLPSCAKLCCVHRHIPCA